MRHLLGDDWEGDSIFQFLCGFERKISSLRGEGPPLFQFLCGFEVICYLRLRHWARSFNSFADSSAWLLRVGICGGRGGDDTFNSFADSSSISSLSGREGPPLFQFLCGFERLCAESWLFLCLIMSFNSFADSRATVVTALTIHTNLPFNSFADSSGYLDLVVNDLRQNSFNSFADSRRNSTKRRAKRWKSLSIPLRIRGDFLGVSVVQLRLSFQFLCGFEILIPARSLSNSRTFNSFADSRALQAA